MSKSSPDNKVQFWGKNSLKVLAFLALTIWVAHFFYFRYFGLYEDDYAYISEPLGWHLSDLLAYTRVFVDWPQGRPIGFFLPHFLAFIGAQLGGLHVIYIIGFVVVILNAFLFYSLLKMLSSEALAVIGALAFGLFPADTTHTFLMHALGLQTSLTFLLLASLCYLAGKRVLPYLIILGSLLTYESPFMVFLGVPLLKSRWDRSLVKELIRHVAILLGIILVVVVIRTFMGEQRIMTTRSNILPILFKMSKAMVLGPARSLSLFFYGPIRPLAHWNRELTIVFSACLVFFVLVLHRLSIDSLGQKYNYLLTLRSRIFNFNRAFQAPVSYSRIAQLFMAALVMLSLAYVLSFTHFPPTAIYGRATSVHLAAAFGGSLVFACVCSVLLSFANAYRLKSYAVVVLACYLSLVVAYRFSIQPDFKQAWQNQRSFWTSAIENLPDMTDETIVFVLDHDLPQTQYIITNSWADPLILKQMFQFPEHWKNPPRLFVVHRDWTESIIREGDQLKWKVPTAEVWSHWEVLPNANVVLLEMENGKLVRRFGSISIQGLNLELKPMPPDVKPTWGKRALYGYLIAEASYQSSR